MGLAAGEIRGKFNGESDRVNGFGSWLISSGENYGTPSMVVTMALTARRYP